MESMGISNCPSALELTIAIPGSENGIHIPSSSISGGNKSSNVESKRELALLDTFNLPVSGGGEYVEVEGKKDRRPSSGLSFQRRKYNRLSQEQSSLLEASFQQNHSPNKGTKQALADTLKVTLKQVQVWFVNRRSRMKKHKMEQQVKELHSYKRQVESLTNEILHLQREHKKIKKKFNKLKLMMAPSIASQPVAAVEQYQQQKQVMYVPVLAGLFADGEQNMETTITTTTSFITQEESMSATANLPFTNTLLLPSSGGSNI